MYYPPFGPSSCKRFFKFLCFPKAFYKFRATFSPPLSPGFDLHTPPSPFPPGPATVLALRLSYLGSTCLFFAFLSNFSPPNFQLCVHGLLTGRSFFRGCFEEPQYPPPHLFLFPSFCRSSSCFPPFWPCPTFHFLFLS